LRTRGRRGFFAALAAQLESPSADRPRVTYNRPCPPAVEPCRPRPWTKESEMLSPECLNELRTVWLPHLCDSGLARLLDLLEKGSPFLISGCFTGAVPMGCLASHAAWHHP